MKKRIRAPKKSKTTQRGVRRKGAKLSKESKGKVKLSQKKGTSTVFDDLKLDAISIEVKGFVPLDGPVASTITPEPRMTPTVITLTPSIQNPFKALPGTVTSYAQYTDHGRNDSYPTPPITIQATATDGSFTIDWGTTIQGSHMVYDRVLVVQHIPTGQTRSYPFHATKGDIRAKIPRRMSLRRVWGHLNIK